MFTYMSTKYALIYAYICILCLSYIDTKEKSPRLRSCSLLSGDCHIIKFDNIFYNITHP